MEHPVRIAVVEAGIAGLTTAWLLEPSHDVTLYEAAERLGGHADTVTVPTGHGEVRVDLGAQYVSPAGFPVHGRLLAALGVGPADLAEAPVTFTMSSSGRKNVPLIVSPHAPDELRGSRTPVTGPAWDSLGTFLAAAADFAAVDGDWTVSLAELLDPLALPEDHVRQIIHPLMAYISSCADAQAPELSVRAATAFFLALAPRAPGHAPIWANATCGMGGTASLIAGQLRGTEIRTGSGVTAVRRLGDGYEITDAVGDARTVDRVVLALPAYAASPLLDHWPAATASDGRWTPSPTPPSPSPCTAMPRTCPSIGPTGRRSIWTPMTATPRRPTGTARSSDRPAGRSSRAGPLTVADPRTRSQSGTSVTSF
nr:FAD-dependent oxidoreductase [Streptomyces sp. NBC_01001]